MEAIHQIKNIAISFVQAAHHLKTVWQGRAVHVGIVIASLSGLALVWRVVQKRLFSQPLNPEAHPQSISQAHQISVSSVPSKKTIPGKNPCSLFKLCVDKLNVNPTYISAMHLLPEEVVQKWVPQSRLGDLVLHEKNPRLFSLCTLLNFSSYQSLLPGAHVALILKICPDLDTIVLPPTQEAASVLRYLIKNVPEKPLAIQMSWDGFKIVDFLDELKLRDEAFIDRAIEHPQLAALLYHIAFPILVPDSHPAHQEHTHIEENAGTELSKSMNVKRKLVLFTIQWVKNGALTSCSTENFKEKDDYLHLIVYTIFCARFGAARLALGDAILNPKFKEKFTSVLNMVEKTIEYAALQAPNNNLLISLLSIPYLYLSEVFHLFFKYLTLEQLQGLQRELEPQCSRTPFPEGKSLALHHLTQFCERAEWMLQSKKTLFSNSIGVPAISAD